MPTRISIRTSKPVTPMIYAYTTPEIKRHDGWIKIGYTEQKVEERIGQQTHTADILWELQWKGTAIYDDGTGDSFKDTDFHEYLRKQGIEQQSESRNEWFRITKEESQRLFNEFRSNRGTSKTKGIMPYTLRNEQDVAINQALDYFKLNPEGEFLWNAKPRFGKTLSVYDLCKRLNATNILIVTNRPAIANSWYDDYCKFIGDENGYRFVSEVESLKKKSSAISHEKYDIFKTTDPGLKRIEFLSLQDLKGSIYFGGKFDKLKHIRDEQWDILVIDEAHEGVDTFKTDVAFDHIKRKNTLHLSGTPFKAIANDKFSEDAIYNWTYVDEQKAKNEWVDVPGTQNPYERLPTLCMFTYQMSEIVRSKVQRGIEIDGDIEEFAFDLNEFFKTKANGDFVYDSAVDTFLDALATQEKYPFSTEALRNELKHTLWLLNRVDSARALAKKLNEHPIFRNYKIVLAAGDGSIYDVKENEKALDRVRKAIEEYDRTITLSVGQLTTGVTVPEWTAVLMLSNISSPALYMQAAFRAQNPYSFREGKEYRIKETAYVFDFDPARTLEIFEKFANDLSASTASGKGEASNRKNNVRELLNFFPVIGEDEDGRMIELDAERVLSIPRILRSKEVVRSGFMSNYLFQNIGTVFGAPQSVINIIKNIEASKESGPITSGKALYIDDDGNVQVPEDKVIGTAKDLFGEKIYYEPDMFDDIINDTLDEKNISKEEENVKKLVNQFDQDVVQPMLNRVEEVHGKELSKSSQKALRRKISSDVEATIRKEISEHKIVQNTLDLEMEKEIDNVSTMSERKEIIKRYNEKKESAAKAFHDGLNEKIQDQVKISGQDIAKTIKTDQVKKEINEVEDKVKSHLRGFTRTIPAFLMAYGDVKEITLDNFDEIIPEHVFKEVTSISLQEFRLLRDGGSITNEDGVKEYYEGHLFDEVVFNDSVKEFMKLKKRLANYFDESAEEDIFDYIPPQKTNQIFTPKKIVKDMVNRLEVENPGCFDDETKTFADLYMKSGLYIAEIVKRLYQSRRIRSIIPDDAVRLNHIFSKQVFGLAPTEIIYRICKSFLLGFSEDIKIEKDNIRFCDALQFAKEGTLEEELERIFSEDYKEPESDPIDTEFNSHIIIGDQPPYESKEKTKGFTVTHRVKHVKQPRGGYINPKHLTKNVFTDGITLYEESISATTMGMVVDYMTRFDQGASVSDAFKISLKGAELCNRGVEAEMYASNIKGLDDESIVNACRLVWFDQVYRTGRRGFGDPLDAVPDHETCENVRTMVKRAGTFFKKYGPVVNYGPTFFGGYTDIISSGDGDFTTKDTIWDFKVSKNEPTSQNTLQIAVYYLMAHHSIHEEYKQLSKIGIFNPRLNIAYYLEMSKIDEKTIMEIENKIIGYEI